MKPERVSSQRADTRARLEVSSRYDRHGDDKDEEGDDGGGRIIDIK